MFWTIRIPDDNVEVDLNDAEAVLDVSNREIEDYFNIVNALQDGQSIPATVSFHAHWSGVKNRVHIHDAQNTFDGRYIEDTATIRWSAHEKDFKFVSDPANTSTTVFAEIGSERNGVFFNNSN